MKVRATAVLLALPLVAVSVAVTAQEEPAPSSARLNLVCLGTGTADKRTSSDGQVSTRSVPFDEQINLWIEGAEGKMRVPRVMLPVFRGGDEGWFEIRSIKIGDDEITGSVAINVMNHPKLRIDRITGAINVSGRAGNYSGRCQKYDPETVERRF